MKPAAIVLVALVLNGSAASAAVTTFGSGVNQFTMEFVTIGNAGNSADTTGNPNPVGSVAYTYNMGKFEVSREMVAKANTAGGLGIILANMTDYGGNGVSRPATGVSWNEAARFVNWLNSSQGFSPAYKFAAQPGQGGYSANANILLWDSGDVGFNASNPFRNSQAHYFLPNVDEWYKAAYYNPVSSAYFDFPTGSNSGSPPTAVPSGTTAGTAIFNQAVAMGPADITLAGGLSPYGVMGQGGNVHEWEETEFDLVNKLGSSNRGFRGGSWYLISAGLLSTLRNGTVPESGFIDVGFRVASAVPESTPLLYCGVVMLGVACWRR